MEDKLRIEQVILVEGRYDAAKLTTLVDGLILTTDGFAIYKDKEKQKLLKELGKERGVIILTDSDAAGFKIRHFVSDLVGQDKVLQAYVPALPGKEGRKAAPGKEGLLGVEGIPADLIRQALLTAGASRAKPRSGRPITYTDLFEWRLSGTANCAQTRRDFMLALGLPPRMSKKALCQVLNTLYTYEEVCQKLEEFQKL